MGTCLWGKRMIWADAARGKAVVRAWSYHGKRQPCPSAWTGAQAVRQSRVEGTALSGASVVVAQDAAEALSTMHRAAPAPDLAWGSQKPPRSAGSTQKAPVVMYRNELMRRGCSDAATADLGDARRPDGEQELPGLEDEVHGGPDAAAATSIASGREDGLSSA